MSQVQVLQGAPQRQKKPAPFRFRGLRKSRENSISAASFFPIQTGPALPGSGLGELRNNSKSENASLAQSEEQRILTPQAVGSIPSRRTTYGRMPESGQ